MRIVDEFGNEIENPDLNAGYLVRTIRIREDATPLGEFTYLDEEGNEQIGSKDTWDDDDYEEVDVFTPYSPSQLLEITKAKLEKTNDILMDVVVGMLTCTSFDDMSNLFAKIAEEHGDALKDRIDLHEKFQELNK